MDWRRGGQGYRRQHAHDLKRGTTQVPRVTQKSVARHGVAVGCRVTPEVMAALISEAKRCKRSVAHITAFILQYWYEDVWLVDQKTKKKGARLGAPR